MNIGQKLLLIMLMALSIVVATPWTPSADANHWARVPYGVRFVYANQWGSRGSGPNQFGLPAEVAVARGDPNTLGDILVSDATNNRVQAFRNPNDLRFSISRFATRTYTSTGAIETVAVLSLELPTGIATDPINGDIYVADTANHKIMKFDSSGGPFCNPATRTDCESPSGGSVGTGPSCFRGVSICGFLNRFGSSGEGDGQFFWGLGGVVVPAHLAVDRFGFLYVTDLTHRIQKFTAAGTFVMKWGSGPSCRLSTGAGCVDTDDGGPLVAGDGQFAGGPYGIAVDRFGFVYVSDPLNDRVQVFTDSGEFVRKWGTRCDLSAPPPPCPDPDGPTGRLENGDGQFDSPIDVAVDDGASIDQASTIVYVADRDNHRVQVFDGTGAFLAKWGSPGSGKGQFNGAPSGAMAIATLPTNLSGVCHLLVALPTVNDAPCHEVFVADAGNFRIQAFASKVDRDGDGIVDEVDVDPAGESRSFDDRGLRIRDQSGQQQAGTTFGDILQAVDEFTVEEEANDSGSYGGLDRERQPGIRVSVEAAVGPGLQANMVLTRNCGFQLTVRPSFGSTTILRCGSGTVEVVQGTAEVEFTSGDGTRASATLPSGSSLTVEPTTSEIKSNAGTITVLIGGNTVALAPGQSAFADSFPPLIQCGSSDGLWHASDVSVSCTATDAASGLANRGDANFSLSTNVPAGVENNNAATGSRQVCDVAGHCAVAGPITGHKVDRKAPTATIIQPTTNQYVHSAIVTLDYTVVDGGSGVKQFTPLMDGASSLAGHGLQSGQVINLLTELSLGTHTFRIDAVDTVGNGSTAAVTFEIIVTPESIMDDVGQFFATGAIRNLDEANFLLRLLEAAARARARGNCTIAGNMYDAFVNKVRAQSGRIIDPTAAAILITDAEYLKAHCP